MVQVTSTLILDEQVAIVLTAIAIVFLIIGIYGKWWELTAVLVYIPEIIIAGIIGLLVWGFRKRIENTFEKTSLKKRNQTTNQQTEVKSRCRRSSEPHLDDLIQEIESFVKNWREGSGLLAGYRTYIERRKMYRNRGKIKEYSTNIRKKIKPLKGLHGCKAPLESLVTILDKMFVLGQEIEATFASNISNSELLKIDQNRIDRLVSDGDSVCKALMDIVSRLEKLR